jgi:hypothetical protein
MVQNVPIPDRRSAQRVAAQKMLIKSQFFSENLLPNGRAMHYYGGSHIW